MPTPDASQFIQMKKYQAIDARIGTSRSTKMITHLYQPVPAVKTVTNFLASFSNKTGPTHRTYFPVGPPTGKEAKPKVPPRA